jgi:L-ascorbate metabolism protein UlaG (beta-lactamase superfamily)
VVTVNLGRFGKTAGAAAGAAAAAALIRSAWGVPRAMGASRARIRPYAAGSANFRDGAFHNLEPALPIELREAPGVVRAMARRGRVGSPSRAIPLAVPLAPATPGELAATWLGHATVIVEIEGHRVLTDPVWSERASPSQQVGPRRMHAVPMPISALPKLDAIVISHDHYDHLDEATVRALAVQQHAVFVVPLGVGSHLRSWGIDDERIVELDWHQRTQVRGLTITCTPARHFSGRGLARNPTLWASWVLAGERRRVYFGGDTGYTTQFQEIGRTFGPFDASLLPVGAYAEQWPDIHMNPEEAIQALHDLNNGDTAHGALLPIHWATFNLALHSWSEPIARLFAAAETEGVRADIVVPMPGQRVDLLKPHACDDWWRARS